MSVMEIFQPAIHGRNTAFDNVLRARLPRRNTVAEAVLLEGGNDAVHLLFPDVLERQAQLFLNGFNGDSLYAVKANPHPEVLRLLWRAGVRHFDVASIREVEQVRSLLPDAKLYLMHPVKSRQTIRRAFALGVRAFSFDHVDELTKMADELPSLADVELFLRLNVIVEGAAYALKDKFGAKLEQAPLLLERAKQLSGRVSVSFHVGSQCLDIAAYEQAIDQVTTILRQTGISLSSLSIGGGFPTAYPGMEPAPMSDYFARIHKALEAPELKGAHIVCEPGRALVAEAGAVAARVELRKGTDLYLNDGTYGALFDAGVPNWPFPVSLLRGNQPAPSEDKIAYRCFGPTCDSCDKMAGPFMLPVDVREGDWVVFWHLGAYGQTMQTQFNGFYSETLVLVSNPQQ